MQEKLDHIAEQVGEIRACLLGDLSDGKPGLVAKVTSHEEQLTNMRTRGWAAVLLAVGAFLTAGWRWVFEHRQ